jgi:hypothetical protein
LITLSQTSKPSRAAGIMMKQYYFLTSPVAKSKVILHAEAKAAWVSISNLARIERG